MVRYGYVAQLEPPAPFVQVRLQNPVTGQELSDIPAQLDSAADRTLIPETLAERLALPQLGTVTIGGVGGVQFVMPSYPVMLQIHDLLSQTIEVVASPGESWILLGRDVLNVLRSLLDGPQQALEIGWRPPSVRNRRHRSLSPQT
jgi:hypothetical protein